MFSNYYLTREACNTRLQLKQRRKLRVLCLHGYNTDSKVMEYQMRHFRQVFNEVMEFTVVDAPFDCPEEPPKELKRFLPPVEGARLKSWFQFHSWRTEAEQRSSSPDCVFGLEQVVAFIIDVLKNQGPFDGVLCFSQGGIMFRHFYTITKELYPE